MGSVETTGISVEIDVLDMSVTGGIFSCLFNSSVADKATVPETSPDSNAKTDCAFPFLFFFFFE